MSDEKDQSEKADDVQKNDDINKKEETKEDPPVPQEEEDPCESGSDKTNDNMKDNDDDDDASNDPSVNPSVLQDKIGLRHSFLSHAHPIEWFDGSVCSSQIIEIIKSSIFELMQTAIVEKHPEAAWHCTFSVC